ncbi:hypothetical protein IP81_15110 [Novosphingobium sp. AAP83]|nr:hypothetical protein IP81_15110 [Novosphingobium sp. AAP83]
MRLIFVVVFKPSLQLFASILPRQEPMGVQAFTAQLAFKRFDERIVRWLAKAGDPKGDEANARMSTRAGNRANKCALKNARYLPTQGGPTPDRSAQANARAVHEIKTKGWTHHRAT